MSHRVADVLRAATAHVSPRLVDAAALARIVALVEPLPAAFNWLGFECRLRTGDDRVDFGVCVDSRDRGRAIIAAALTAAAPLPGLEFVRPLLAAWTDPASLLHRASPVQWLEWDIPRDEPPQPFAFVCVDPAFPRDLPVPPLSRSDLRSVAAAIAALLTGTTLADSTLERLDECAATAPWPARILHLAPLPQDRGGGLRLHSAVPAPAVLPWLRALGWPGDLTAAADAVALCRGVSHLGVQLTLGERLRPYLGLEYYSPVDPRTDIRWPDLMTRLVAASAADPDKADAVLRWFGDETVDLPGSGWFVNIQRQFYVKLVVAPAALEAKVYLTLHPRYIPW